MQVAVVKDLVALDALRDEWEALERQDTATGFQSFAWCRAWLALAARLTPVRARPQVVVVREAGRLVMVWPMQWERRWGVRIVRWIGEPLTQYGDVLAAEGSLDEWRQAVEREMRGWRDVDLVCMSRVRTDSRLAEGGFKGRRERDGAEAPYVDLADPANGTGGKSVRRREKRLAAMGAVALVDCRDPGESVQVVREALALKAAWLRARGKLSTGLSNPATSAFLEDLARQGTLRVHVLRVGGVTAAVDLGLVGGGAYRSFLSSYDARFVEGSPGQVLTRRLIQNLRAEGLRRFDLLAPADLYKLAWATGQTTLLAQVQIHTGLGLLYATALRLRPAAKAVFALTARLRAGKAHAYRPAPAGLGE